MLCENLKFQQDTKIQSKSKMEEGNIRDSSDSKKSVLGSLEGNTTPLQPKKFSIDDLATVAAGSSPL